MDQADISPAEGPRRGWAENVRRNTIANAFGFAWTLVMGVAFLPLYVRYLGVEAYGLIGVFGVVQAWLLLLEAAITPAMTRETSRLLSTGDHREIWQVLRTSEAMGGAAALLSFAITVILALFVANAWLDTDTLSPGVITVSFFLMGGVIATKFVENVYRAALVGLEQQVRLNVLIGAMATLRYGGAVVVLMFVSRSIVAFFVWQAIVSVLALVTLALASYLALPGRASAARFSRQTLLRIWRFSAGTFLIAVLGTLLSQIDKLMLSAMLPLREFGYYAFAGVLASYVRQLVQPIYQAIYPRFVALAEAGDDERLAQLYHFSSQLAAVLLAGVGTWLAAFALPVVSLWTRDPDFAARVAPVLAALLLGFVINGMMSGPYYLQLAHGWTSLILRLNLLLVVLLTPAIWLAVSSFGMTGAAGAWAAVNLIYLIVAVQLMHRRILPREMTRWYLDDLLRPIAAAGAMALLVRLFIPLPDAAIARAAMLAGALGLSLAAAGLAAPMIRLRAIAEWRRLSHG